MSDRLQDTRNRVNICEAGNTSTQYATPKSRFKDVFVGSKLIFRFDPVRGLVQIRRNGIQHVIDLSEYME